MSCDLTNGRLLNECQLGRAGIKTLYFTKFNDFDSLTGIVESGGEITDLGTDPISLYQFDMQDNVGNFEEIPASTPENGTIFLTQNVTLTLFYVKPEDLASLNNLKRGRWTIWALDFQGKIRLFGRTRGMVASGGSDVSGAAPGDKKGLDLILTAAEQDYAPFMADYTTVPFDNFTNVTVVGVDAVYSAEYQSVYDSFTSKPTALVAAAQDTMVRALVAAGVWSKLDLFYVMAGHTNGGGESFTNWMNPGTFDLSELDGTPKAFVAFEGFTGSGDGRLTTGWNISTDSVNYTQDDAGVGCYVRTNILEAGFEFGNASGNTQLGTRYTGDAYYGNVNAAGGVDIINDANNDSRGFFVMNRTSSTALNLYKNASSSGSSIKTSTALSAQDIHLCGYTTSLFSTKQLSVFFIGASLNGTEITAFTNAVEAYMDSNGKGVIP